MTSRDLVIRSLTHFRGLNLAVLAGVALTSAIISGALVVGDSVKESLRRNAAARYAGIGPILVGGERMFEASLADRVGGHLAEKGTPAVCTAWLQIEATAYHRDAGRRLNRVQVIGVDDSFWKLSPRGEAPAGFDEERWMAINQPMASRIGAATGDTLVMRVELPGALSKDAPLSGESEQTIPFTGVVASILDRDDFGLYSLRAEQIAPATIFLPIARLQEILEQPGKANLLAAAAPLALEDFSRAVQTSWTLADAQLTINPIEGEEAVSQVTSARIFFDRVILEALSQVAEVETPVLTYLATDIRCGDRATPYSMITGAGTQLNTLVDASLGDDEILLSDWLTEDLAAKEGDEVTLVYDVVGSGRKLVEQTRTFRVAGSKALLAEGWNRTWTPDFPGIFDVEDLDDWEPGIPIDRDRIRDKDDDFWKEHRATPKAFVSLAAARSMWANRFGDATAMRLVLKDPAISLVEQLRPNLQLTDLGMVQRDLPTEAAAAVAGSLDFGALFASMSFFLIISALLLTGLLFAFGIEQRASQIGLLLALGFARARVRRLLLTEALILATLGSALGLLGGYVYTRLALNGMAGVWSEAAAGITFEYALRPATLLSAFIATLVVAAGTVWLASRRVSAIRPSQLISGGDGTSALSIGRVWRDRAIVLGAGLAGLGCLFAPKVAGTMAEQGLFFGAGFLFTAAGVGMMSLLIRRFITGRKVLRSIAQLGRRQSARRRGRSLAVVGLMAAGVFMVTAVNSFRLDGERGAERRNSGTGGFAWVGEATLPIYEDLNAKEGREKYGIDPAAAVTVVAMRVSAGDDASCLNLNRAQLPRIMSVPTGTMEQLNPFQFTQSAAIEGISGWGLLTAELSPPNADPLGADEVIPIIPGVVDMNTATYALQLGLGGRVIYDNGSGVRFAVQIVGMLETSLLQGSLLIDEAQFIRYFPDAGGYSFFLLDGATPEATAPVAATMTRMFGDRGLELRPAAERLNEFNAVQNTYLSIFSTLGGLGLFLGTLGLGIVVARNVLERRGQLGVMQSMGFTRRQLARLVLAEHWFLHLAGVLIGFGAALVAVIPKLQGSVGLPWPLLIGVNLAVLLGGLVFCAVAARLVVRGPLYDAIRAE